MTRYFLRHPLAAKLPRKFKIAFEGCARGSRARVDQRHRLARAHRGRQARVPRDGCRRHVDSAGVRLRALRLHAGRRDVQRRRGGGARVPPVRRLRASVAQSSEVHDQGARLGRLPAALRGSAGGVQASKAARRCRSIRSRAPASEQAPDWAPADAADAAGRRRGSEHAGERPGHHARHGSARSRCPTATCAGCAATSASSGRPATAT